MIFGDKNDNNAPAHQDLLKSKVFQASVPGRVEDHREGLVWCLHVAKLQLVLLGERRGGGRRLPCVRASTAKHTVRMEQDMGQTCHNSVLAVSHAVPLAILLGVLLAMGNLMQCPMGSLLQCWV